MFVSLRVSELRMVELLEDLCELYQEYTWGYRNPNDGTPLQVGWVHVDRTREIAFRALRHALAVHASH